jgi:drug/metabolite transporter (DMT)-like permease
MINISKMILTNACEVGHHRCRIKCRLEFTGPNLQARFYRLEIKPGATFQMIENQPATSHTSLNPRVPEWVLIVLALFAVYVIWGSTYLAIALAVKSYPPFLMGAIRFLIAGGILYSVLRWQDETNLTRLEVWNAARIGVLMIVGSVGLVTLTEFWGAPSGVVATVLATVPFWSGFWSSLWGRQPNTLEWLGMGIGLLGVAVLTLEHGFQANPITLIVFLGPACWALGSIWSQHLPMPKGMMASALEMLSGGLVLGAIGLFLGEYLPSHPTITATLSLAYLAVFGSLVAFSAYLFLLGRVRPALATSFAYVNPVVALGLGLILGEPIGINAVLALPIILTGMVLIALAQSRAKGENNESTNEPRAAKRPSD